MGLMLAVEINVPQSLANVLTSQGAALPQLKGLQVPVILPNIASWLAWFALPRERTCYIKTSDRDRVTVQVAAERQSAQLCTGSWITAD